MKVAVATFEDRVSEHFGKCLGFTFADVDENGVTNIEYAENPGGHCAVLPDFLASRGVKTMIVGGIGPGAVNNLYSRGINVIGAVSGKIEDVLEEMKKGTLKGGAIGCEHDHDHEHHHH